MKPDSVAVKFRSVTVTLWPWHPKPHLTHWRFRKGRGHVSRASFAAAKTAAAEYAQETYFGTAKVGLLSDSQTRLVRRLIDADPTLAAIDEFLVWRETRCPVKPLADARREFLATKLTSQGRSKYHLENLRKHLAKLPDKPLGQFTLADFPPIPGAARTRSNVIAVWRQFFGWCRKMQWLPYDQPTPADRLEVPPIQRKDPSTWSPAELAILFEHVEESYLPWLALAAWAGIRAEELAPDGKSTKDALRWSDVHLDRSIIIIRPEVSKTNHRRVIPIPAALAAVLRPLAGDGTVCPKLPPHTPRRAGIPAETTRLGKFVGGWKRNALRHSFISYRAAQVGLSTTAMEAGNSEAEAKASYHSAMTAAEADSWFKIAPSLSARLNQICTKRGISPFPVVAEKPVKSRVSRRNLA